MTARPKERGVLMSAPMVRATLSGDKEHTRRVVKPQFQADDLIIGETSGGRRIWVDGHGVQLCCPYGEVGDQLWVRETWRIDSRIGTEYWVRYRATEDEPPRKIDVGWEGPTPELDKTILEDKWRPSLFMPRWASRITLEIKEVWVERLHDIDIDDIAREGIQATEFAPKLTRGVIDGYIHGDDHPTVREAWRQLWDSINGKKYPWASNPFVWVISFRKL